MAVRALSGSPNIPHRFGYAGSAVTYTRGDLLYRDTTNGQLLIATGSNGTGVENTTNIEGIFIGPATPTSGAPTLLANAGTWVSGGGVQSGLLEYEPIIPGPSVLYVVDCQNAVNANQIFKNLGMYSSQKLNNTSSSLSGSNGYFITTSLGPTSTGAQLIGYFTKSASLT